MNINNNNGVRQEQENGMPTFRSLEVAQTLNKSSKAEFNSDLHQMIVSLINGYLIKTINVKKHNQRAHN